VLLVNSPYAPQAVSHWRQKCPRLEMGWHPCLTLDQPILPASQVTTLVDREGRFHRLGSFLKRLLSGRIKVSEIESELSAQYNRFQELVGFPPSVVNSHHHVQVFSPVGQTLLKILARQKEAPYLRRVQEPWRMVLRISGARLKRLVLSYF